MTGRATRPIQQHLRSPSKETTARPYITMQRKYSHLTHLSAIIRVVVVAIKYQRRCSRGLSDILSEWAARSYIQASEPADGTKMAWNAASDVAYDPYK